MNGIAEQLVLRDLGGLVIIDFIDGGREHQRLIQLALRRAATTKHAPMSRRCRAGLVEMTRQRRRPAISWFPSRRTVVAPVWSRVQNSKSTACAPFSASWSSAPQSFGSGCASDLVVSLMNARRHQIDDLEQRHDCKIAFVADSLMKTREFCLGRPLASVKAAERQAGRFELSHLCSKNACGRCGKSWPNAALLSLSAARTNC